MYKTIMRSAQAEVIIEKSRFIGHIFPVRSEQEAQKCIEQIKKQHWQASHNVPVYLLEENHTVQRFSDDGEPSGSAGLPVLEMLKHEGLTDLCLVMTRYFGGVKLGVGGLIRAYTECAKASLKEAGVVEIAHYDYIKCQYDYTLQGKVTHLFSQYPIAGLEHIYTDVIESRFYMATESATIPAMALRDALVDLTSGKILLSEPEILYGCVNQGSFQRY